MVWKSIQKGNSYDQNLPELSGKYDSRSKNLRGLGVETRLRNFAKN
jgi:hypothetical protein